MAHDGSVIIDIDGDDSKFRSKLAGLGKIALKSVAAASGALAGLATYAIKVGSSFETAMSDVSATMQISQEDIENCTGAYKLLHDAAIEAGATTKYSATEAAEALNYLALAGYDAQTAASVLPSVLNLAAASGMDLAAASDMATDAMAALGIEASNENLTAFGDQMAMTAAKANTSVSQLGEAILTVGGTAKTLAGGTTELNAALGVLANRGIKGAEGGTQLRNIIKTLSAPTDAAAKAMENLGLKAYDADGNFRPLNETFADLKEKLSSMSQQEQNAVLSSIFNAEDLKSAQALIAGTGEEFDKLAGYINASGGAMQDMADTKANNLAGAIDGLKSRCETLGIAFYESVDNPIKDVVNSASDGIAQLTESFQSGGLDAMFDTLGSIAADAVTQLANAIPQMAGVAVDFIAAFASGIASAAPEIAAQSLILISQLTAGLISGLPALEENGSEAVQNFANGIGAYAGQLVNYGIQLVPSLIEGISGSLSLIADAGVTIIDSLTTSIRYNLPQMIPAAMEALVSFSGSLRENVGQLVDAGLELITTLAQSLIDNIPVFIETVPTIITNLASIINDNAPKLLETGISLLGQLALGLIQAIPTLISNIPQIITAIVSVFMAYNWIDMGKSLMTAVKDGISSLKGQITAKAGEIGNSIKTKIAEFPAKIKTEGVNMISRLGEGITSKIGDARTAIGKIGSAIKTKISELPQQMKSIGGDIVRGIWNGINDKVSWIISMIGGFKDRVVNAIKAKFGINSPSKVMRTEVGRWLPLGIAQGVDDNADAVQRSIENSVDPAAITRNVQGSIAEINRKLTSAVNSEMLRVSAAIAVGQSGSGATDSTKAGKTVIIDYHPEQKCDEPVSLRDMDATNRRNARHIGRLVANA